jgi:glycosyltransferase involved in cell wall biosynthesis
MKPPKISVALATYNGEKYIQEQLSSLCQQKYLPHELVVGDDGSTDSTYKILNDFIDKAPFSVRIIVNDNNLGYSDNFLNIANNCSGEWIAFCDQDDVWLPNKLEICANTIRKISGINMILQNSELCDSMLNRSGRIFPNTLDPGLYSKLSQYGFWVWPGFLKTVRSSIINELDFHQRPASYFPKDVRQTHDKWTCMIANSLGGIYVQNEVVALYRRHKDALTGDYAKQSTIKRISIAQTVKAEHYRYLAKVARDSAKYLLNTSDNVTNEKWVSNFKESANAFIELSVIQDLRADLYETGSKFKRLKLYLSIWTHHGYLGSHFKSLGWQSALKDFTVAIRGINKLIK